jgi:hypothetical protein
MPTLHEIDDQYIYDALNAAPNESGPKYIWDDTLKLYKYTNTLFPNKIYKKTFNPKSFMSRGDVVHFGDDDYRNNNKMIFNGEKLEHLHTDVDDYGSVPPTYVAGDGPDEFNIGDFEDIIDHNSINWLSKDTLKKIEIFQKDNIIYGEVTIKGKKWIINFEISDDTEFNTGYSHWGSRQYNCIIEDDNIFINKVKLNNFSNVKYKLNTHDEENYNKFKSLVKDNPKINIINFMFKEKPNSQFLTGSRWYAYVINKEYKLDVNNTNLTFPLIWKKVTENYTSETLILDDDRYNFYIKCDVKELDKIYINEVTGYPINIKLIENNTNELIDNINKFITSLIDNYDNIDKRYTFNKVGHKSLEIYL